MGSPVAQPMDVAHVCFSIVSSLSELKELSAQAVDNHALRIVHPRIPKIVLFERRYIKKTICLVSILNLGGVDLFKL